MSDKPYILSVDDESLNQEIVVDLLEDDFDIRTASNGQECLDIVAQEPPKLILLDVNMPVLNGLDTCIQLKANDNFKDIPIIFVSALASPKEIKMGNEAGGDDYITKPFDEDMLIKRIFELIK